MRAFVLLATVLIGLALPARAADEVAAAQGVIRAQVDAFSRDDAAAAYSHAAPAIQNLFPQPDIFMAMVRGSYAPVYRHKSFEFGEARASDGQITQRVHIIDADGCTAGGAVYAGAASRRQPEDHRLHAAQGRSGGLKRFQAKWCRFASRKRVKQERLPTPAPAAAGRGSAAPP